MTGLPSSIGPYRILRLLGEGGMGSVFEAINEAIERRVAIKVLHPEYARNSEFIARFFNEARAVNRIGHPGLVQISDYGQHSDGTAYIVMEFLEGETLARRLERSNGKLSTAEVLHLGLQIAASLAAAHAKSIVHRDLKPENVMIVADSSVAGGERTKLLDFGIAKVSEQKGPPRVKTKTDQVMGTAVYMSPEQCEGAGNVDAKSDVYSLGVMLFEMLAGRPPFVAEGAGKILGMHMFVEPPLLRQLAPEIPSALAELVQRMLVKNKDKRPSIIDVVNKLELLGEQHPLPKRSGSISALMPTDNRSPGSFFRHSGLSTLGESAAQTLRHHPNLRRLGILLGGAGLAVLTVALLVTLLRPTPTVPKPSVVVPSKSEADKIITLRVDSEPPGAEVLRIADGQFLGRTPWQVTQSVSEERVRLRLHLEGHEEQEVSLSGQADDRAIVALSPRRPAADKKPKRAVDKPGIPASNSAAKPAPSPVAPSPVAPLPSASTPAAPSLSDKSPSRNPPPKPRPTYAKPPIEK